MIAESNNLNSQAKIILDNNTKEPNNSNIKEINQLINNLRFDILNINRLDYYSNTIPIGSFCNSIVFILYGFQLCHVFKCEKFIEGVILIFGALGQITTGILEYIKQRTFPSLLYFTHGFFCLSLYFIEINLFKNITPDLNLATYYSAWMIIYIPITISSIKVNFFYILHTFLTTAFFILEAFGQGFEENKVKNNAAGVVLSVAGFISLYIFLTQIINEAMKFPMLPAIPIKPNNEVDITQDYRGNYEMEKLK